MTKPEMLIWPMTAQRKDSFPSLFVAREPVITFGLISPWSVSNVSDLFLEEGHRNADRTFLADAGLCSSSTEGTWTPHAAVSQRSWTAFPDFHMGEK